MKTKLACILGLVLLATSPICGGSLVYADALEAESSVLVTLAPNTDANGAESLDKLHCVLYSDGADNCIVNAQASVVDQPSSTADETEPSATDPAAIGASVADPEPAVRYFDAIPVVIVQSVTIAAPGLDPGNSEEPASTASIPASAATDTASTFDAGYATDALSAPAGQSAGAIVVAVVQSATIAAPGQSQ
jgi:hypothetical protein